MTAIAPCLVFSLKFKRKCNKVCDQLLPVSGKSSGNPLKQVQHGSYVKISPRKILTLIIVAMFLFSAVFVIILVI